jgi:PAS domain-containing protein
MGGSDMKNDPVYPELRFSSVVPIAERAPVRKWITIPIEELQNEVIRRNGPFQIMLGFMRHLAQASVVLDSSGRVIFINAAMEVYWGVQFWDVLGRPFATIMRLDEMQAERNRLKRERATSGNYPEAFLEPFHQGNHNMSMYCFPFPDDNNDLLLGAFILPHPPISSTSQLALP